MSDEIVMRISSGLVDTDFTAKVEISSAYKAELESLLDDAGVEHAEYFQKDLGSSLLAMVAIVGALGPRLAPVLHEFFHRHDGKEFNVEVNGEKWSAKGVDEDGFISMMQRVDDQKRKNEEAWQESIRRMDEADGE